MTNRGRHTLYALRLTPEQKPSREIGNRQSGIGNEISAVGRSPSAETDVARLSVLVACAAVLQVAEALLPYPLPGIRLGLANMVTLIALVEISPGNAFKLALLRSLISSLILGTFLTPTFVLSFSGAMASAGLMVGLFYLSRAGLRFSLIGISVAGSVSHVLTQLGLVYLLFVRNPGVLLLWPWLAVSGVVMGIITGVVAVEVCRRLERKGSGTGDQVPGSSGLDPRPQAPDPCAPPEPPAVSREAPLGRFEERDSAVHRMPAEAKLIAVVVLALVAVVIRNALLYFALLGVLALVTAVARVRFAALAYNLRRMATFMVLTFLLPLVFTPAGEVLLRLGPLKVTMAGLASGAVLTLRIIVLFFATSVLALTTSPEEVARGLERLLAPLALFGISARSLARVLALSWSFFPLLWQRAQEMVKSGTGRKRGWSAVANFLPDLVTGLYLEAERIAGR